jgi:hypothetical protein
MSRVESRFLHASRSPTGRAGLYWGWLVAAKRLRHGGKEHGGAKRLDGAVVLVQLQQQRDAGDTTLVRHENELPITQAAQGQPPPSGGQRWLRQAAAPERW